MINNCEEITEACISVKISKDNANEEPNHPVAAVKSFDMEQSLISIGDNTSDNHTIKSDCVSLCEDVLALNEVETDKSIVVKQSTNSYGRQSE